MQSNSVEKPKTRSAVRQKLGREYYIIKRRIRWFLDRKLYAKTNKKSDTLHNTVIEHRSFLLRPLKDVDMRLQHNKITNLRIAIGHINGVVIRPGERFSIWRMVGRPKASKGYLEGLVLSNGQITSGTGGGLCQLGNLIYWMALHTPLSIVERWRHSFDVFPDINRKIPFACGATLAYNYIDLQLENNTPYTFRLDLWLDDQYLNGRISCDTQLPQSYEIYETDHSIQHQWWGGYTRHNKIWKKIISTADATEYSELVAENNAIMMYNPLLAPPSEYSGNR